MTWAEFWIVPTSILPDGLPTADVNEDLYVATGYTTGPDGKPVPKLNSVDVRV